MPTSAATKVDRFNVRVYGILIHRGRLLVSDEVVEGAWVTKFPGGGLEPGEGAKDGLKREIREELGMEAKELRHFYTTDFFQQSAYREEDQIISIYYTFRVDEPDAIRNGETAHGPQADRNQHLRWIKLAEARPVDVDLPIDRVVMQMILEGNIG